MRFLAEGKFGARRVLEKLKEHGFEPGKKRSAKWSILADCRLKAFVACSMYH
jgi:hypothetical protein